jgi:2-methylisocitrate lyase-like PEP mutase family enzyme
MTTTQNQMAARFRAAHAAGKFLVLPNAWDVASARIAEDAGAEAIATSSAAVAWAHGYADGETLPKGRLLQLVGDIVRLA